MKFKNKFIALLLILCTLNIALISTVSYVNAAIMKGEENHSSKWSDTSSKPKLPSGTKGKDLVELGKSFKDFTYQYGGKVLSKGNAGIDCAAFCCRMVAGLSDDDKCPYLSTSGFRDISKEKVLGTSDSTGTFSLVAHNYGGIPRDDMVVGWILVSSGHAVIYAGDGKTIEAMGKDYGICQGTVKEDNTKYTHAFVVSGITYGDESASDTTTETTDNGDGTETTSNGTVVLKGAYSENMLASVNELNECTLTYSDPGSLSTGQTYTLNNWVDTIDSNMKDTLLVTWMRRIVTILGIAFTVWMIFLYLAYWFDRVNIFFEFSLLPILSFNRLVISPDEDKCTWQFSEMIKSKNKDPMTVNNRAMLEIVIIGCIFGGMVISGVLFKIVRAVIIGILKFLNIL